MDGDRLPINHLAPPPANPAGLETGDDLSQLDPGEEKHRREGKSDRPLGQADRELTADQDARNRSDCEPRSG